MRSAALVLMLVALTSCAATPIRTATRIGGPFQQPSIVDQTRCADTPEAADAIAACIERRDRSYSG